MKRFGEEKCKMTNVSFFGFGEQEGKENGGIREERAACL